MSLYNPRCYRSSPCGICIGSNIHRFGLGWSDPRASSVLGGLADVWTDTGDNLQLELHSKYCDRFCIEPK